jgi:benzoate-CoA ligase
MSLSTADHSVAPPRIDVPRDYNAAHDLIERNLAAGRGAKIAYIDDAGATRTRNSPNVSTVSQAA